MRFRLFSFRRLRNKKIINEYEKKYNKRHTFVYRIHEDPDKAKLVELKKYIDANKSADDNTSEHLSDKNYIKQASLSSMKLPRKSKTGITMKGFRVFVKIC